jgi:predicted transcriptional regulator
MLVVETIARIRVEHFVKGKTIKEIARDLGVSRNTVGKVLRSRETSFEYERTIQPRPKLGRGHYREHWRSYGRGGTFYDPWHYN